MIRMEEYGAGDASSESLAARMEVMFSPSGGLAASPDFEYRAEQQQMAVAVARALESRHVLCAEAGTGVGKSLAYLIPAVEYAIREGKKAVISTHTINLQEQLNGLRSTCSQIPVPQTRALCMAIDPPRKFAPMAGWSGADLRPRSSPAPSP